MYAPPILMSFFSAAAWWRIPLFLALGWAAHAAEVRMHDVHAAPDGTFRVTAGGAEVPAGKFKENTLAWFSFTGEVELAVRAAAPIRHFTISPRAAGIAATADGAVLRFRLDRPRHLVITIDGARLFLFADPLEENPPRPGQAGVTSVLDFQVDPTGRTVDTVRLQQAIDTVAARRGTLHFPPGIYLTGTLALKSDLTLHLAAGAVLLGSANPADYPPETPRARSELPDDREPWLTPGADITPCRLLLVDGARRVRITGRGIIDGQGKRIRRPDFRPYLVLIRNSADVTVDGVMLRDSALYSALVLGSDQVTYRGVKVVNDPTVPNTDGLDPDGSRDVLIERCFLACGDDPVAVKTSGNHFLLRSAERITVRGCVLLTNTSAMKLGSESFADIRDVRFEDNDIVEADRAITLSCMDGGRFERIQFVDNRVERLHFKTQQRILLAWVRQRTRRERPGWGRTGAIADVLIRDLAVAEPCPNPSRIAGLAPGADVRGIRFENFTIAGRLVRDAAAAGLEIGPHAADISFAPSPQAAGRSGARASR